MTVDAENDEIVDDSATWARCPPLDDFAVSLIGHEKALQSMKQLLQIEGMEKTVDRCTGPLYSASLGSRCCGPGIAQQPIGRFGHAGQYWNDGLESGQSSEHSPKNNRWFENKILCHDYWSTR
jgi:hypothetical protein